MRTWIVVLPGESYWLRVLVDNVEELTKGSRPGGEITCTRVRKSSAHLKEAGGLRNGVRILTPEKAKLEKNPTEAREGKFNIPDQ